MDTSDGKLTSREDFLRPTPRRFAYVDLPNGQTVRIRSLTERENRDGKPSPARVADLNRRLIVLTLVDENGDLLLNPGDVGTIESLDSAITGHLADAIGRHVGVTTSGASEG